MDNIVLHVQKEVALDGESGCNWGRFWYLVDEFLERERGEPTADPSKMKRTDEKFQQFFWNNFVQEDGALFYIHAGGQDGSSAQASKVNAYKTPDSRASYVPFGELVDLDRSEISYQKVAENYKDRIRIVASVEQQRYAVLGYSGAKSQVSEQGFRILQSITATRELGATQAQLAKMHEIDPRSMFHFLKVLIESKHMVKIPVTTDGQYTLLCLHKHFASLNPGYKAMNSEESFSSAGRLLVTGDGGRRFEGLLKSDTKKVSYYNGLIKQKLTDILGRSKNHIMMIEDLAKALDLMDMNVVQNRWFNRQIELLCKLKYIKRVQAPGFYRCVQLLRPFGASITAEESEAAQLNLKSVIADDTPQSGIFMDISIEHQVYKHIVESKEKGLVAKEIRQKMNMLNSKLLARILMTLIKPVPGAEAPLVNRVVEFVGRERRYRYYSLEGFKASVAQDHKDYLEKARSVSASASNTPVIPSTEPTLPSTSSDTSVTQPAPVPGSSLDKTATSSATGSSEQGSSSQEQTSSDALTDPTPENMDIDASQQDNTQASTSEPQSSPAAAQVATPERFISVALLTRRKVLLSILERKRIVELHASLVTEYQQEKARLFPGQDETSVIDRKTLFRTVNILADEGLVKLYKVDNMPLVGSGTVTKAFCLHHSIGPESDEVKAFVKECSNRHVLFGSLANRPMKKAERVDLAAETLEEMQERLGQDFYKAPTIPLADVGAVKPGSKDENKPKTKPQQRIEYDVMDPAIEYGWNKAKMMRALVFHRFVLDKLGSEDRSLFEFPSFPNVLSTSCLFEVMSLRVFLLVVGIPRFPEAESKPYLEAHRDSNIPIKGLPDDLRQLVAPNTNFKKRLREVLEVLDALGLVSPLMHAPQVSAENETPIEYATNHLVLNTHYQVHVNVKAPLHPLMPERVYENLEDRKEYILLSPKECRDFWVDLQTSASSMKYFPSEKSADRPWTEIRRTFLLNLCNKKIWADPIRITPSQREMLMTLVNNRIRYIPPPHDPKMDQMAKDTGLPKDHIFQFYKAIKAAWHAHPISKRTARLPQVKSGRQTLIHQQEPRTEDHHSSTVASASGTSNTRDSTRDTAPANKTQEREGRFGSGQPRKTRAKRILWTDEEDERLLQSYAVLRCISEIFNVKFSWHGVANALSDKKRGREVCRHRFDKLIREVSLSKRVDAYRAQFTTFISERAEEYGVDRDLKNFDPSRILDYFRPAADVSTYGKADATPLPKDPKDIEEHYIIRQQDPYNAVYLEERLHSELSLPRRLRLLQTVPPTLRCSIGQELNYVPEDLIYPGETDDTVSEGREMDKTEQSLVLRNEKLAQHHLILALVKAIYCLPKHKRPRAMIRAILEDFPADRVHETCEMAKDWRILTSIKKSSYRIPGQKVGGSERLASMLNGAYPRRFTVAATGSDETYAMAGLRPFRVDAGPAEMMVFLTDMAMGWLQLSMAPPGDSETTTAFEEPYGQGAILHFEVNLKNTRESCTPMPLPASSKISTFSLPDDDNEEYADLQTMDSAEAEQDPCDNSDSWERAVVNSKVALGVLVESLADANSRQLYESLFALIATSCTTGMMPQDIKDGLRRDRQKHTDKEIMTCIRTCETNNPPILVKVGAAHVRYVVFGHHQTWTVNYVAAMERVHAGDGKDIALKNPRNWIVPRMWRTLDGAMDHSVYETSLHAVLSHIAEKPGVSKGALIKTFHKVFMSVDLDELTEELERRGALTAKHGILPAKPSLFSKRGVYMSCERDTIDERMVTNYFAEPAYYSYLDMSLVVHESHGSAGSQRDRGTGGEDKSHGQDEMDEEEEEGEDDDDEEEEPDMLQFEQQARLLKKPRLVT
ncbi:hypothetical protein B0O80DRAFT_445201 [Mortierella sp. GBAus27b]|nr:hypothetical protein B0O80DRAFT_445201 [Mortierella sp. GBAus27b]